MDSETKGSIIDMLKIYQNSPIWRTDNLENSVKSWMWFLFYVSTDFQKYNQR